MDKADCSWTPKIKAKERVNNLGLPCGAPYGLTPLDHGRSDKNWNNNNVAVTSVLLIEDVDRSVLLKDCGYSLELPRQGSSNEYHNLCFEQK